MYINFDNYRESGLSPQELIHLLAVKWGHIEQIKEKFITYQYHDWFTYIKGKPNQPEYEKIRLSDKGKEILAKLSEADVEEQDKKVFEWLKSFYLKNGKEIGNGAKTQRHIRDFRIKSGIEKNKLILLCKAFLTDESNMEYNHVLEYAFYKPATAFEKNFKLEESRIYQYYLKRKEEFDEAFKKFEDE